MKSLQFAEGGIRSDDVDFTLLTCVNDHVICK